MNFLPGTSECFYNSVDTNKKAENSGYKKKQNKTSLIQFPFCFFTIIFILYFNLVFLGTIVKFPVSKIYIGNVRSKFWEVIIKFNSSETKFNININFF